MAKKEQKYKDSDWDLYAWPDPPDDTLEYGPTDMQEKVFIYHSEPWERPHNHPLDIVLLIGGAGSGKSATCIANVLELSAAFPNCVSIVAGKNMPLLKRNVVDKFGERLFWISPEGIRYPWKHPLVLKRPGDKTPFTLFKNNASIRFLNIDDPDIVRGFTADVFVIEEVNLMKADSLKEMFRRSRGTALPVRQFILNMNPTGRRDWVYDMFNLKQYREDYKGPPLPVGEPCECQYCHICSATNKGKHEWEGGDKKIGPNGKFYAWVGGKCPNPECPTLVKTGKPQVKRNDCPGNQHYYRVIISASTDNPHLPPDFAQLQRGALSDEEYATYVEGKIVDLNTGTIYKEFSSENIVECEFNPEEDIYWTMDFNFDPMCSVICQEREDGLFCVDEFTLWNSDEMDVARAFCKRYQGYKGKVWLFGDPNGVLVASRADSSRESFKVIHEYLKSQGFNVEMGFKKVKGDTLIPIISRINNLKASIKNVEGVRRIFVSPKCFNLIESLKGTVWKETSPTPKEDDNCDDVARGNPRRASEPVLMTHPQAALGYLVFKRFPVILRKKGVRLLDSPQTSIVEKSSQLVVTEKAPLPPPEEEVFDPYKPQSLASMFGIGRSILEERLAYEKAQLEAQEKSSLDKIKNFK